MSKRQVLARALRLRGAVLTGTLHGAMHVVQCRHITICIYPGGHFIRVNGSVYEASRLAEAVEVELGRVYGLPSL